jgi:hypothetical protein
MSSNRIVVAITVLSFLGGCKELGQEGKGSTCAPGAKCDSAWASGRDTESGGYLLGDRPTTAGPEWLADWTMLIYAANDDKSSDLVAAFDQDEAEWKYGLGGSSLFRVLVQRDYAPNQTDELGLPRQSERYGLYREMRFHPISHVVENPNSGETGTMVLGETDTGNPATLSEFLEFGIRRFPAKRYWVIITGHGDSWNGLATDASSRGHLSIAGLQQALGNAQAVIQDEIRHMSKLNGSHLSRKIDVVQFDTCRLGAVEVAAALTDSVDYGVASQEVMPNAGHPYSALRALAQDHTGKPARSVVKEVVADYVRSYVEGVSTVDRAYVGSTVSSVGLDLRNFGSLVTGLKELKDAVVADNADGFTCQQVLSLASEAKERGQLVDSDTVDTYTGRGAPTAVASVDLVSLLEVLAGQELRQARMPQGCPVTLVESSVDVSPKVRQQAMRVLDIIGRPHVWTAEEPCASKPEYDGQYRKFVSFKARSEYLDDASIASPFVVEAHKVSYLDDEGKERYRQANGLSVLWGDPYEILLLRNGVSPMDTYRTSTFEKLTGWSRIMGGCIDKTEACMRGTGSCDFY